jgi:hypothetical protein
VLIQCEPLREFLGFLAESVWPILKAHCFNGKENGILDQATDKIKDFAWQAYNKGVVFDIGHGTDHLNEAVLIQCEPLREFLGFLAESVWPILKA